MNLPEKQAGPVECAEGIGLACPHCKVIFSVKPVCFKTGFHYECANCGGEICLTQKRITSIVHQLNAKLAGMKAGTPG